MTAYMCRTLDMLRQPQSRPIKYVLKMFEVILRLGKGLTIAFFEGSCRHYFGLSRCGSKCPECNMGRNKSPCMYIYIYINRIIYLLLYYYICIYIYSSTQQFITFGFSQHDNTVLTRLFDISKLKPYDGALGNFDPLKFLFTRHVRSF